MKKVIFENGLRVFLTTCCFLFLGAVAVSAQGKLTSVAVVPGVDFPPAPSSPVYDVPQGIFVNSLMAVSILDAAMVNLKEQMMQQNDPAMFAAMQIKYKYYRAIHNHLDAGATTANAIAAGLWIFLENVELGSVPLSTQQQLKSEAIDLLN